MVGTNNSASEASTEPSAPLLRVVKGDATPEEIAALVAVVASLGGGEDTTPRRTPEWSRPERRMRATHAQGPGGWRGSGLPR
ncbi:hypothetical protein GCM10027020_03380 [Nocardioides salsibiostraticola]